MTEKKSKNSIVEAIENLTGYEEMAIEEHFDYDVVTLLNTNVTKCCRALLYAEALRTNDHENAWKKAMSMTVKQVGEKFAPEEQDTALPGEEPTTQQGKGVAAVG